MSFKNWPMIWKVISLLLLLAGASLAGIIYTTHEITVVDGLDSAVIEGPAAATTEIARAARFLASMEAAIYENIVTTTDADNALAAKRTAEAVDGYEKQIALAKQLYPEGAAEFDGIAHRARDVVNGACAQTIHIANEPTTSDTVAQASMEMEKNCHPKIEEAVEVLVSLTEHLRKVREAANAEATSIANWTSVSSLVGLGVVTLAILVLAVFVVRLGVVAPIRSSIAVMGGLGRGELATKVAGTERRDEIGAIAQALEILRGQLQTAETARREQLAREEAERQLLARREKLATAFVSRMQDLASGFAQSSGEVAGAARNLSATAEETSRQAQAVAAAAEQAAANVQTVAASSEEMAASVKEINAQVSHSADVANAAYNEAEASSSRISALATAASAIGDVINLIKGIADQTNLLALNATIEAARAGEAGKGFAVVAAEVKQLASQTAKATDEIGSKVGEIQQATDGTVKSMTEIVRVIGDIKSIASAIAGAIEEQGAATGEIARNCQQAAVGTHQVTQNIAGVGQAAEMTGSASTQLMSLSDGLSHQATDLRGVVETFVRDFAAA